MDTMIWTTILGSLLLLIGLLYWSRALFTRQNLPPGPPPLPLIGHIHLVGELAYRSFSTLAQKYGPIMYLRMGSFPTLVISSASLAKEILQTNDLAFASRPRKQAFKVMFYDHLNMAFMPYGTRWRQMRMLYTTELLSLRKLESMVQVREEETRFLLRSLWDASQQQKALDLSHAVSVHALNLIMRVVISTRLSGYMTSEEKTGLRDMLEKMFVLNGLPFLGDFLPWLQWFDLQGYLSRMKKVARMTDAYTTQLVNERRRERAAANPTTGEAPASRDFLDVLLSAPDDEMGLEHLSDEAIKASLLEVLGAGSDSSSAATTWALAEVLRNPEITKKAQHELDSVVGRSRSLKMSDLPHLKYLQAIVKESLRLHTPAPILHHLSKETCKVAGYTIPKGTTVLVNAWAIARDETIWESPLSFCPERFMDSKVDVLGHDFELLPFGAGRRTCPGLRMGVNSVELTLGALLHGFDWRLPNEDESLSDMKMEEAGGGVFVHRKHPLMLIPTPRLPDEAYSH